MKTIRSTALFVLALALLGVSADAQRTRRPAPKPTPKPTPVKPNVNAVVSVAKQQVSNQLHNVNVFVARMGPIAVAIENADRDAAARKLSREEVAANDTNKQKIIAAIRGLNEGLVALETDFRTKPQLAPYLPKLQGISTLCGQSEDHAIAGKFVASKDPLREVALKLNETLAILPGPVAAGASSTPARPQPVSNQTTTITTPTRNVSNTSTSTSKREPATGMTPAEVAQSTWGEPNSKRISTTANGTTEVWVYSGNRSVYFFNGKVSQILK